MTGLPMAICRCSFCGADADDAGRLVATEAQTAAICLDCAQAALEVFAAADAESAIELTPSGRAAARWFGGEQRS